MLISPVFGVSIPAPYASNEFDVASPLLVNISDSKKTLGTPIKSTSPYPLVPEFYVKVLERNVTFCISDPLKTLVVPYV